MNVCFVAFACQDQLFNSATTDFSSTEQDLSPIFKQIPEEVKEVITPWISFHNKVFEMNAYSFLPQTHQLEYFDWIPGKLVKTDGPHYR